MNFLDPYSHTRIVELRQEQLARRAKRRSELGLDELDARRPTVRRIVSAVTARFGRAEQPAERPAPAPKGRPALDS